MGDMRIGRRGSGETRAGSLGNPVGGNPGKPDVMGKPGKRAETRTAREISFGIRDHQMVAERGRPSATSRATLVERIFEVILLVADCRGRDGCRIDGEGSKAKAEAS